MNEWICILLIQWVCVATTVGIELETSPHPVRSVLWHLVRCVKEALASVMADCNSALVLQRHTAILPLIFPHSLLSGVVQSGLCGGHTCGEGYLDNHDQSTGIIMIHWGIHAQSVALRGDGFENQSWKVVTNYFIFWPVLSIYSPEHSLQNAPQWKIAYVCRCQLRIKHNNKMRLLHVHCHTSLLSHVKSCQVLECRHKEVTNEPGVGWFLEHPVYYRILQGQNGWLKTSTTATCKSFTGSPKFQRNGVITTAHRLKPTDILSVYKILITFQTTVF
jgi:hypothetical protein